MDGWINGWMDGWRDGRINKWYVWKGDLIEINLPSKHRDGYFCVGRCLQSSSKLVL